ncbi:MAG TPA: hypothetical protein VFV50_12955 [Bdellovibrionales bacterium]|nr:hypothetical protein [Bdellovibrionales bacterium]
MKLTLVGTCARVFLALAISGAAFAAPETPDPDLSSSEHAPESGDTKKLELLEVTKPPPPKGGASGDSDRSGQARRGGEIFFPYQSAVSPRVGVGTGSRKVSNENVFYFVGLNYMLDSPHNRHFEVGVDLTSQSHGLLHLAYKWIYDHNSSFRPYWKAGPTIMLVPNEQLGTFLKPANFQARAGVGFEKLLRIPMSLRADLETAWISGGYEVALAFGYSWAW